MQPRKAFPPCISLGVLALVLACGCNISPKPEPPSIDSTPPVLDPAQVLSRPAMDGPPEPTIEGHPGAVQPPEGLVRATLLDAEADPVDAIIQPDGSFALFVDVFPGDEVRLQVIGEEKRSDPLDFLVGTDESNPQPAPRPLASCFELEPAAQLDVTRSQQVVALNQCGFDVRLDPPALRRPAAGWAAGEGQSWPLLLAPGASVSIQIQAPTGADPVEEIVFIQAGDPQSDRRPITVFRDAP